MGRPFSGSARPRQFDPQGFVPSQALRDAYAKHYCPPIPPAIIPDAEWSEVDVPVAPQNARRLLTNFGGFYAPEVPSLPAPE